MNERDFCYWLQGMFELSEPKALTVDQTAKIKAHLDLAFVHSIDPISNGETTTPADTLNAVHGGLSPMKPQGLSNGGLDKPIMRC